MDFEWHDHKLRWLDVDFCCTEGIANQRILERNYSTPRFENNVSRYVPRALRSNLLTVETCTHCADPLHMQGANDRNLFLIGATDGNTPSVAAAICTVDLFALVQSYALHRRPSSASFKQRGANSSFRP